MHLIFLLRSHKYSFASTEDFYDKSSYSSHVFASFHLWMPYFNWKNINRNMDNSINIYGCLSQLRLYTIHWVASTGRHSFSHSSKAEGVGSGTSKAGSWWGLSSFSLCPHTAFPQFMCAFLSFEEGKEILSLLIRPPVPLHYDSAVRTARNLIYCWKPYLQTQSQWGLGLQHTNLSKGHNSVHTVDKVSQQILITFFMWFYFIRYFQSIHIRYLIWLMIDVYVFHNTEN